MRVECKNNEFVTIDKVSFGGEGHGLLSPVFKNGHLTNRTNLQRIKRQLEETTRAHE